MLTRPFDIEKKKTIALDLDDVLNTLVHDWLIEYNSQYNDNAKPSDITSWNIAAHVKHERKIYDILSIPGFFDTLGVQPYAKEVTEWLTQYYNICIVTAFTPETVVDKRKWVSRNFPWIKEKDLIFCNNKGLILADYLIDDGVHNLEAFKGTSIVFDTHHNQGDYPYLRIKDWIDGLSFFVKQIHIDYSK
jgi:5'(3')-deoxyribonucleotidase